MIQTTFTLGNQLRDAEVIQSALNATQGIVFLRAGEYYVNKRIDITSNRALIGEGFATVIKATSDFDTRYAHIVRLYGQQCEVANLVVDGTDCPDMTSAIMLEQNSTKVTVRNCYVIESPGHGISVSKNVREFKVINNIIAGARVHSICVTVSNDDYVDVNGLIANNYIYDYDGFGIYVRFTRNLIIKSNIIDASIVSSGRTPLEGINIDRCMRVVIDSNVLKACPDNGMTICTKGIAVGTYKETAEIIVTNNYVRECARSGIRFEDDANVGAIRDCVVANNICVSNGYDPDAPETACGIRLGRNAKNFVVIGNRCYDDGLGYQNYGVSLAGESSNNLVIGNVLVGNVSGGVNDLGTNNTIVNNIT